MTKVSVLAIAAVIALTPASALASEELRITDVDASRHPQVTVTVNAAGSVGRDLPPEVFTVTEAGRPRDIDVEALPAEEQQVVVTIDTSGSMGTVAMEAAKDAAAAFVRQLPPQTRVAVVEFNARPRVVSPLSNDTAAHANAIGRLSSGGETALYDAIGLSLDQFEGDQGRAIVVLSDGGDTASTSRLKHTLDNVAAGGANVYVVELQTSETQGQILKQLARAGNGRVVSAANPQQLAATYNVIAGELPSNYILRYRSDAHGRTEVRVVVDSDAGTFAAAQQVSFPSLPPAPVVSPPPVVPPPRVTPVAPVARGVVAPPWILWVGAALVFLAITLLLLAVLWPREARSVLATMRAHSRTSPSRIPGMSSLANRATLVVEQNLQRRHLTSSVDSSLERAGIALRSGEFVLLSGCAAVTAFSTGLLFSGPFMGLVLTCVVLVLAVFGLKVLAERRRAKFADQLPETLQLLSGSLRAGYSLLQAVDAVALEADSPTAEEYRRIVLETRLGRELDDALHAMDRRVGTEDFQWVVQAINIHREVGGDLAEVLDTVAGTIRERNQIRGQVKSLSAEGKLSAIVLFGLPFAVAGFVSLTNPSYLAVFVNEPIGWAMLGVSAVMLAVGGLWLRKVVQIRF